MADQNAAPESSIDEPQEKTQADADSKPDADSTPQEKTAGDAQDKKPPTPPHTGVRALLRGLKEDVTHIPTRQNLYLAGIGGGLAPDGLAIMAMRTGF